MSGRRFRALVALDARAPEGEGELVPLLRARGFDVRHASAADDAWRIACRETFDVIVAELASLESRNLDLIRRARRSLAPGLALLAITSPGHELERAARLAGAHVTLRSTIARELVVDTAQRLARPIERVAL